MLLSQGEPGAPGISGVPGLPGEDGAPGQKVTPLIINVLKGFTLSQSFQKLMS